MKFKILILLISVASIFPAAAYAQKNGLTDTQKALKLAAMLPDSDGVVALNSKKLFSESLPQILTTNPSMLAEINGHAENLKQRTGIDIKQFDRVAIGTTITQNGEDVNFDPVILAQGAYAPASLLSAVKLASAGEYREEKIGEKTIYLFTIKKPLVDAVAAKPSFVGRIFRMITSGLSNEVAVGAVNQDTLAFGSPVRVRQAFGAGPRAGASVLGLPGLQHGGLAAFGARTPMGLSPFISIDMDELGKSLDSVRFMSGWMDLAGDNTVLQVKARTTTAEQAQNLTETLQDLQAIGKVFIAGAKGPERAVYGRMIDNAKFSRMTNEMTLDLQIPQADINILVAEKK